MDKTDELVMYIFINSDLNMSVEETSIQVANAMMEYTKYIMECFSNTYLCRDKTDTLSYRTYEFEKYIVWSNNDRPMKVMKTTTEEIESLSKLEFAFSVKDKTEENKDKTAVLIFKPMKSIRD